MIWDFETMSRCPGWTGVAGILGKRDGVSSANDNAPKSGALQPDLIFFTNITNITIGEKIAM